MKIIHIADIGDNIYSGVQVVVPKLIANQQRIADVCVINLQDWKIPGVQRQYLYSGPESAEQAICDLGGVDIAIFHEVYKPKYLEIYKLLRKKKIPYIVVPHVSLTYAAQQKKHLKKVVANAVGFKKFVSSAAAIQCLSQNEYDNSRVRPAKFICPNGIDIPAECRKSFAADSLKIVFIGRIDIYHKGLDILLQAVSLAEQNIRLAGGSVEIYGPESPDLMVIRSMIAEYEISDLVTLHPPVIGEDKRAVLLDTDIFIQTSRMEGMPMGILEAWSYGIPTIITEGTAMLDTSRQYDCGWCAETTAESVAAAIRKAIKERALLSSKAANARSCITDNFNWEVVAQKSLDLYKEVLKNNG